MSVYMTEQEQIERIKRWWNNYSSIITIIFSLVLLSIAGYKYWNWHEDKVNQQASTTYENMMLSFSNQDNKGVRAYANQLVTQYTDTVYADAARLTLAKLYIARAKYKEAQTQLDYVASHSRMPAFQQMAKIRMARLLITKKLYEKALAELNTIQEKTYISLINEIKGDIYAATGRYIEAVESYRAAINEVQTQGMGNLFLEMKSNELAALASSLNAKNEAMQAT